MRILFMGTPMFAKKTLEAVYLTGKHEIAGVFCQPDKPKGRGMKMIPCEVKVFAKEHNIPVFQPVTLKDNACADLLSGLDPELILVASYGKILPPYVLNYPKYGCINAHASLLPLYRGASPINRAIMNGERETGITAMYMDEGLDTGDMIDRAACRVYEDDTYDTLHDRLASLAGKLMVKVIDDIEKGTSEREAQNDSLACYASKIGKEDQIIDFDSDAENVINKIRGLSSSPCAITWLPDGKLLKITKAVKRPAEKTGTPGKVIELSKNSFILSGVNGNIEVLELVPEGKGKMSAGDFVRGRKIDIGDILSKENRKG